MRYTQPVMPSPTRSLSWDVSAGSPWDASISSSAVVGLKSATEPLVARITRTASRTTSCNAACGSSVEWMTLLT